MQRPMKKGLAQVASDLLCSHAEQGGFSLWVRNMYKVGDRATFTHPSGRIETFTLRGVDEAHLQEVRLEAGGVTFRGFHYLPKGMTYAAGAPVTCPRGSVRVVDASGVQIDPGGVSVTITPDASYNNDPYNLVEATVMVTHPTGIALRRRLFSRRRGRSRVSFKPCTMRSSARSRHRALCRTGARPTTPRKACKLPLSTTNSRYAARTSRRRFPCLARH